MWYCTRIKNIFSDIDEDKGVYSCTFTKYGANNYMYYLRSTESDEILELEFIKLEPMLDEILYINVRDEMIDF